MRKVMISLHNLTVVVEYLGGVWPVRLIDSKTKKDITKDFLHVLEDLRCEWAGDQDSNYVVPDDGSF